jgi:hypothetical protein
MGFFDEDDEYDEPDWREQQEEEAEVWHQILEGSQDEEEWDEPPSASKVFPFQSPAAPAATQGQSESRTGSPSRSPETPKASVDKSPLRRRRSDIGSPVKWLIANSIVYQVHRKLWVEDGQDVGVDIEA